MRRVELDGTVVGELNSIGREVLAHELCLGVPAVRRRAGHQERAVGEEHQRARVAAADGEPRGCHRLGLHQRLAPYSETARSKLSSAKPSVSAFSQTSGNDRSNSCWSRRTVSSCARAMSTATGRVPPRAEPGGNRRRAAAQLDDVSSGSRPAKRPSSDSGRPQMPNRSCSSCQAARPAAACWGAQRCPRRPVPLEIVERSPVRSCCGGAGGRAAAFGGGRGLVLRCGACHDCYTLAAAKRCARRSAPRLSGTTPEPASVKVAGDGEEPPVVAAVAERQAEDAERRPVDDPARGSRRNTG